MPKAIINADSWDDYVRELRRTGHERIVSVWALGDGTRYQILTEPLFVDQFTPRHLSGYESTDLVEER